MDHILCVIISCIITRLLMRRELDALWDGLKANLTQSAEWVKEDRERVNEIVRDINRYYGGKRDTE